MWVTCVTTSPTHHAVSHCSAVLDAGLGGDIGPGEQRAQQGLGLSVQPLRDGAGAQAGQGWTDVLDIISGTGSQGKRNNATFTFSPATSGQVWPRGNEITVSKWSIFLLPKKDIILSRVDDPRWCRAHMWIHLWGRLGWSSSRVGSGAAWSPCSRRSWWQCCSWWERVGRLPYSGPGLSSICAPSNCPAAVSLNRFNQY